MTTRPYDFGEALDDLVTTGVRRLRDGGLSHEQATERVRAEIEKAHGLLIGFTALDRRDLELLLLDAGTNVEAFARRAVSARERRRAL